MPELTVCPECIALLGRGERPNHLPHPSCSDFFRQCDNCAHWFLTTEEAVWEDCPHGVATWWGRNHIWLCDSCFGSEYFVCDSCDHLLHRDGYGEGGLCLECIRENEEETNAPYLYSYHSGDVIIQKRFLPNEEETKLFLGVELETDDYTDTNRCIATEELHSLSEDESLLWLEEDSSLSCGIEIITQPCSLAYHLSCFPWAKVIEAAERHGGKSHDTDTCGLHIHFSNDFFENKLDLRRVRLIYLFEKFWDEFVQFSRRGQSAVRHNANKYNRQLFDCSAGNKIDELHDGFHRYQAVNIVPEETTEIRIFRGSLKLETIFASLELVDFLVRLVKRKSTKYLQQLTWKGLVKLVDLNGYQYLPAELIARNLRQYRLPLTEET